VDRVIVTIRLLTYWNSKRIAAEMDRRQIYRVGHGHYGSPAQFPGHAHTILKVSIVAFGARGSERPRRRFAWVSPTPRSCSELVLAWGNSSAIMPSNCSLTAWLERLHVLFFLEIGSRRVHYAR